MFFFCVLSPVLPEIQGFKIPLFSFLLFPGTATHSTVSAPAVLSLSTTTRRTCTFRTPRASSWTTRIASEGLRSSERGASSSRTAARRRC